MKQHFKQRIDDTRQAYLHALTRLKNGTPNHPELKGKEFKINATTIALEADKSRNPLYHTHKDILEMIHDEKTQSKTVAGKNKENSEIDFLKKRIKELETQNKKLISVNATLLAKFNNK